MWLSTQTRSLYGSNMIPSGRPSTSIVLITFKVFESHMVIGLVVENPWWDLGSTAAPPDLIPSIAADRFERIQIENRQLPHRHHCAGYTDGGLRRPRKYSQNRLRRRLWPVFSIL